MLSVQQTFSACQLSVRGEQSVGTSKRGCQRYCLPESSWIFWEVVLSAAISPGWDCIARLVGRLWAPGGCDPFEVVRLPYCCRHLWNLASTVLQTAWEWQAWNTVNHWPLCTFKDALKSSMWWILSLPDRMRSCCVGRFRTSLTVVSQLDCKWPVVSWSSFGPFLCFVGSYPLQNFKRAEETSS